MHTNSVSIGVSVAKNVSNIYIIQSVKKFVFSKSIIKQRSKSRSADDLSDTYGNKQIKISIGNAVGINQNERNDNCV